LPTEKENASRFLPATPAQLCFLDLFFNRDIEKPGVPSCFKNPAPGKVFKHIGLTVFQSTTNHPYL